MSNSLKVHRIPITKARINLGQIVRRAHVNNECFILEKDGIPVAGIIDIDELEDYLEMKDPNIKKQIAESYRAYENGQSRPIDAFLTDLKTAQDRPSEKS
jgi:hypothetical protein